MKLSEPVAKVTSSILEARLRIEYLGECYEDILGILAIFEDNHLNKAELSEEQIAVVVETLSIINRISSELLSINYAIDLEESTLIDSVGGILKPVKFFSIMLDTEDEIQTQIINTIANLINDCDEVNNTMNDLFLPEELYTRFSSKLARIEAATTVSYDVFFGEGELESIMGIIQKTITV